MAIQLHGFDATPLSDGELVLEFVRFGDHPVHRVPTYYFRITHKETGEELGVINLRCSSVSHIEQYAGHVGFAVHEPHRGHRYAARSIALLIAFSKQLKFESVYITCDPRRSIGLAGGEYLGIVDVPANCIIHKNGSSAEVPLSYRGLGSGS